MKNDKCAVFRKRLSNGLFEYRGESFSSLSTNNFELTLQRYWYCVQLLLVISHVLSTTAAFLFLVHWFNVYISLFGFWKLFFVHEIKIVILCIWSYAAEPNKI